MALNRRDFLGLSVPMLGAAVAGSALGPSSVLAQDRASQPLEAAEGEPRITDIRYYAAGRGMVKISTDDRRVFGWGEITTIPSHHVRKGLVDYYKPLLIGLNPTRIEHIWQLLFRSHRNIRGGMLHLSVIGGIDMALWDLVGRHFEVPVYTLLGGPERQSIRYYPNARAHKVTSHNLHYQVETPGRIGAIVNAVRQARERVGSGGLVMLDGHGKFSPQVAIQVCKQIEDQHILFFEEVVPPENKQDLRRVKEATTVPLACGERMAGMWAFRQPLETASVDVLNPDVVRVGGISQLRKLATIAEMYRVPLAPHGTHGPVGLSATLHVCAAVNNFLVVEAYQHIAERDAFAKCFDWPADSTSLPLPPGPGLGIEVDEHALDRADRDWDGKEGVTRGYFTPDGAVADR